MLCEPCQYVVGEIQKNPPGKSTFRHHASIGDWERAVQQNCLLCRRLEHYEVKVGAQKSLVAETFPRYLYRGDSLVSFAIRTDEDFPCQLNGLFCLHRIKAETDRLTIPNYVPTNAVGSPQSMALARQWISECIKHHSKCRRTEVASKSVWAPDRLIYIDDENSRLRLVRGADVPSDIPYTTLSHCWGRVKDKLVLTRANIEEWHDQLPSLGKWKTFVDAVEISRQLQIRYMWIDSLCIIQDSKEDWQQQYPQMCNIYKRSYCNIAATSAVDDTEGCLFERDITMDLPLRLCFATEGYQSTAVESMVIPAIDIGKDSLLGQYDLCRQNTWVHDITYSPLNSRGWVLQERQLSPRVLNFTKTQMYWECDEMQASESHPYGLAESGDSNLKSKAINPFRLKNANIEEDAPVGTGTSPLMKRAFDIWANAVSAYTVGNSDPRLSDGSPGFNKNLTNPADKLVAISAIAHELQPYMNCRYLAGHWETDLVRQLAWTGSNGSQRVSTYRAPSWSWASVDAPIHVFHSLYETGEEFHPLAEVLNVEVELLTDDPMGQVTSGSLTLRCYLIELEVQCLLTSRYGLFLETETETIMVNGEQTRLHIQLDDEHSRPTVPWSVYCVPISLLIDWMTSPSHPKGAWTLDFRSILLEKTEIEGKYQRVGFLGSRFASDVLMEDFVNDPILRAIGSFDSSKEDDLFSLDTQGLQEIKIV
ncbi:hypothetical protein PFICI_13421 [Pestalotiopsis fici W106-1]|uniref:Heterokaryon incompatibility domain-containing protein n=1 Tax=Pestalotiopsis fici (strain W106-1 / CGMCC3.15140) TaxID=1229662 RepID=W3WP78_PESFW|nr:uncharacterized protein PFICI_13421 [Pestalotiopsis fici W106-1]ETS74937.1 hypothetical protein PFICI_13421 [Pestalotiopsis fici W106-1]